MSWNDHIRNGDAQGDIGVPETERLHTEVLLRQHLVRVLCYALCCAAPQYQLIDLLVSVKQDVSWRRSCSPPQWTGELPCLSKHFKAWLPLTWASAGAWRLMVTTRRPRLTHRRQTLS